MASLTRGDRGKTKALHPGGQRRGATTKRTPDIRVTPLPISVSTIDRAKPSGSSPNSVAIISTHGAIVVPLARIKDQGAPQSAESLMQVNQAHKKMAGKQTSKPKPPAKTAGRKGKSPPKPPASPAPRGRGRPTSHTPELAAILCRRIASGQSLRKACEELKLVGTHIDESTVRQWVVDDYNGFYPQYTRAIQARAIRWAEEIIDICDDGSNDTYTDPETGAEKTNHEIVARSRLRVDTRKWMLSKVLPKVYGDKLDVNHGVQPENPLATMLQRIAGTGLPVVKGIPE